MLSASIGILGVAALVFIIYHPDTALMALVFSALGAVAACAPPVHILLRLGERASIEARTLVETEKISMLIAQAKLMGLAIVASSEDHGLSKAKHELIEMLLNDLEKASLAQKGRANVLRDDVAGIGNLRGAARISPNDKRVIVSVGDQSKFHAKIIDVSLSGVAVDGHLPGVGVGSDAVVGSRKAKVIRLLAHGAAFQFATPLPAEQFGPDIVL